MTVSITYKKSLGKMPETNKSRDAQIGEIKKQAIKLAKSNKKYEPQISAFYWFPHPREIRLLEVENDVPKSQGRSAMVFYFGPSPLDGLHAPSAIGLIRPEEVKKLRLPRGWSWNKAVRLSIA